MHFHVAQTYLRSVTRPRQRQSRLYTHRAEVWSKRLVGAHDERWNCKQAATDARLFIFNQPTTAAINTLSNAISSCVQLISVHWRGSRVTNGGTCDHVHHALVIALEMVTLDLRRWRSKTRLQFDINQRGRWRLSRLWFASKCWEANVKVNTEQTSCSIKLPKSRR